MAIHNELQQRLIQPFDTSVYYFASTEAPLLAEMQEKVRSALKAQDAEETRIDGPSPNLGEVIEAAGAISFFGTQRLVTVHEAMPSAMSDKDVAELAALFEDALNAILLVTVLYKDKKTATSKKAKSLLAAATKAGFAAEIAKPTARENLDYIQSCAKELNTGYAHGAASALLERAGADRILLKNETAKLAAISAYSEIGVSLVEQYGTHNIEADVFALARHISAGQKQQTFVKLGELLQLKHEPIAITAALAGTFIDMYRVRCGAEQKVPISLLFKEMGYKGSEYRLQKAKENAAKYSTVQLEESVFCLAQLDTALKSSALPAKSILLEAAIGKLLQIGAKR